MGYAVVRCYTGKLAKGKEKVFERFFEATISLGCLGFL